MMNVSIIRKLLGAEIRYYFVKGKIEFSRFHINGLIPVGIPELVVGSLHNYEFNFSSNFKRNSKLLRSDFERITGNLHISIVNKIVGLT